MKSTTLKVWALRLIASRNGAHLVSIWDTMFMYDCTFSDKYWWQMDLNFLIDRFLFYYDWLFDLSYETITFDFSKNLKPQDKNIPTVQKIEYWKGFEIGWNFFYIEKREVSYSILQTRQLWLFQGCDEHRGRSIKFNLFWTPFTGKESLQNWALTMDSSTIQCGF